MITYTISFTGRKANAIGTTYPITAKVTAESLHEARLKLYEQYEHLTNVKIRVETKNGE